MAFFKTPITYITYTYFYILQGILNSDPGLPNVTLEEILRPFRIPSKCLEDISKLSVSFSSREKAL